MTITKLEEQDNMYDFAPIIDLADAHKRPIVKMFFLATYKNYALVTVAHDSLKVWNVIDDEENTEFENIAEVTKWRCGIQSADMRSNIPEIVVVGLDSVLYRIGPDGNGRIESAQVDAFDFGYMEAWNCIIDDNARTCITTSYSGNITEIDIAVSGRADISRKEKFPKVHQICCMAYSNNNRIFALASNEGLVTLFDHDTMKIKYPIEVHSVKIRAMLFTLDDEYLLTGADDKTIRLSQIRGVDKSSSLVRQYCGHNSPVLSLSLDPTSRGARFASCSMTSQIFIWDINQPLATYTIKSPHDGAINCVLFSHSGHHLFSAGEDKRLVCYRIPQIGDAIVTVIEHPEEEDLNENEHLFADSPYGERTEQSVTPTYEDPNQDQTNNDEDLDDV